RKLDQERWRRHDSDGTEKAHRGAGSRRHGRCSPRTGRSRNRDAPPGGNRLTALWLSHRDMKLPVAHDDQIDRLRGIPAFSGLDDGALERIVGASTEVTWPAGQVLARADDPGAGMFIVDEGTVL